MMGREKRRRLAFSLPISPCAPFLSTHLSLRSPCALYEDDWGRVRLHVKTETTLPIRLIPRTEQGGEGNRYSKLYREEIKEQTEMNAEESWLLKFQITGTRAGEGLVPTNLRCRQTKPIYCGLVLGLVNSILCSRFFGMSRNALGLVRLQRRLAVTKLEHCNFTPDFANQLPYYN